MTDIALTAAQIAPCFPDGKRGTEIVPMLAAAAITQGQAVYMDTDGKANLADADGSGTLQFRGIALEGVAAGQVVNVLKKGACYGFTVSGLNGDAILYLSNTAGALADAGGGTTVQCGRVMCLTGASATKVSWIEADWLRTWA